MNSRSLLLGQFFFYAVWAAPLTALVLLLFSDWSPLLILVPVFLIHIPYYIAVLFVRIDWFCPVTSSFQTDRKEVWITIDDGPAEDTPQLLDLLDRYKCRATFFLIGKNAERYPKYVKEMVRRGHQVGNHTYSHPASSFWLCPPRKQRREIEQCNKVLQKILGHPPELFRSPVGLKPLATSRILEEKNLHFLGWSIKSKDGVLRSVSNIVERVKRRLHPGGIVLLHQGRLSNQDGESLSLRVIEDILRFLQESGYETVIPSHTSWVSGRRNLTK